MLRCKRLDVSSAVQVRFSEGVLCILVREQDALLFYSERRPLIAKRRPPGRGGACFCAFGVKLHGFERFGLWQELENAHVVPKYAAQLRPPTGNMHSHSTTGFLQ